MVTKQDNPFKYGVDPELNTIFDKLVDLKNRVASEFAKAEKIAGFGEATRFAPIPEGKITLPNYRELRSPNGSGMWSKKVDMSVVNQQVQEALRLAKEQVAELELAHAPLLIHNKMICDQVTEIMTRLGVASTYTTYELPTARSRTKKAIAHSAGYLGDLTRTCPRSNVSSLRYQITEYERNYDRWVTEQNEADKKERIDKDTEAVNKNILGDPILVATLMQAGVNILDEVRKAVPGEKAGVIEYCVATAINNTINKDMYLKVGYYLLLSRQTTGPESLVHATNAMNAIVVDKPVDQEIKDSIEAEIAAWNPHVAGRRFLADAEWTYSNVMHLADTGLRTLLEALSEYE